MCPPHRNRAPLPSVGPSKFILKYYWRSVCHDFYQASHIYAVSRLLLVKGSNNLYDISAKLKSRNLTWNIFNFLSRKIGLRILSVVLFYSKIGPFWIHCTYRHDRYVEQKTTNVQETSNVRDRPLSSRPEYLEITSSFLYLFLRRFLCRCRLL